MLNPQTQFIHIISDCCPEDKRNINRCGVYIDWGPCFKTMIDIPLGSKERYFLDCLNQSVDVILQQASENDLQSFLQTSIMM